MNDIVKFLQERRSVTAKKMEAGKVLDEHLENIIKCGLRVPDHGAHDVQPMTSQVAFVDDSHHAHFFVVLPFFPRVRVRHACDLLSVLHLEGQVGHGGVHQVVHRDVVDLAAREHPFLILGLRLFIVSGDRLSELVERIVPQYDERFE